VSWYVVITSSVLGGLVTALVNVWLQYKSARRLDRERAAETRRQDQQRAEHAAALEQVRVDLARYTQLSTSGEQKRAEVAAEVLVGVLRMLDALDGATFGGIFAKRVDDAPVARHQWAWLEADAREASVRPLDDEFRRAWHLAEVFLPEDVRDLFDRINKLKGEILGAHRTYALVLEQAPQHAVEVFKQGYGTEPSKKVGEVRAKAKELLRPIAQLGAART
jgi:hypothetical protein